MSNQVDEPRVSSADQVLRAIEECREYGKAATRQSIAQMTGLALTTVDDRVKFLRSVGKVKLAGGNVHGVYEPAEDRAADRPISNTILPTGRCKVEVGDSLLELTPREARHLAIVLAGFLLQFQGS